jgi:uncharacterized protein YbaA (DUF1428 family)
MARYVDGFVIPVPKKNLAKYKRMAALGKKVWKEKGALDYRECVADDLGVAEGCGLRFDKLGVVKPGETIVFSYIVYKSRAHRDRVNAAVMRDPRILAQIDPKKHPFDAKRMAYAGFKTLVGN